MGSKTEDKLQLYTDAMAPQAAWLHDTSAEEGLIPDRMVRPPDGQVESGASVELMIRVAYALMAPMKVRELSGVVRDALTHEKAAKAGCPVEVWHQMTRHPEFKSIYMQVMESTVLLPSLPDSVRAQNKKAMMGDKDAFDNVQKMLRLGDNPDEEGVRKQLRSLDDVSFEDEVRGLLGKGNTLFGRLVAPRTTSDRTQEILDGEAVLAPPPEEEALDHAKLHDAHD